MKFSLTELFIIFNLGIAVGILICRFFILRMRKQLRGLALRSDTRPGPLTEGKTKGNIKSAPTTLRPKGPPPARLHRKNKNDCPAGELNKHPRSTQSLKR